MSALRRLNGILLERVRELSNESVSRDVTDAVSEGVVRGKEQAEVAERAVQACEVAEAAALPPSSPQATSPRLRRELERSKAQLDEAEVEVARARAEADEAREHTAEALGKCDATQEVLEEAWSVIDKLEADKAAALAAAAAGEAKAKQRGLVARLGCAAVFAAGFILLHATRIRIERRAPKIPDGFTPEPLQQRFSNKEERNGAKTA